MIYQRIPESSWRRCHRLVEVAASIKKNAVGLINGLSKEFGSGAVATTIGLKFADADADGIANFDSPVGAGRLRLEFRFQGDDLTGRYVVERRDLTTDAVRWKPVWAIGVGSDFGRRAGYWYGDDPDARFNIGYQISSAGSDALFAVGMSIVAAMIEQPNPS